MRKSNDKSTQPTSDNLAISEFLRDTNNIVRKIETRKALTKSEWIFVLKEDRAMVEAWQAAIRVGNEKFRSEVRLRKKAAVKARNPKFHTEPKHQSSVPPILDRCVYTLLHSDKLDAFHKRGGVGSFTENKKWKGAELLLTEARSTGKCLPLIFAAGEYIYGLIYWALVGGIKIDEENGTSTIIFTDLKPLKETLPLSTLRVVSTREPLPDSHIHNYVLCYTPDFLRSH